MTLADKGADRGDYWRARVEANIAKASAQRVRDQFREWNPHLVGDALFEARWRDHRKPAAVLIPVIERPEPTVLLTVRSSDTPSHAGQIAFPGGRVQSEDRDIVETALRETEEEVGISRRDVDILGALGVHHGGMGFSVTPVVGVVSPEVSPVACPREVAEIFEAPLAHFADLKNFVMEERSTEGVRYKMVAAPYERFHIWGLTAGILRSFAETLQDAGSVRP